MSAAARRRARQVARMVRMVMQYETQWPQNERILAALQAIGHATTRRGRDALAARTYAAVEANRPKHPHAWSRYIVRRGGRIGGAK